MRIIAVALLVISSLLSTSIWASEGPAESKLALPQSGIVIIANKNITELNTRQIYRLFTLRQKLLPSNTPVKLAIQPLSVPTTKIFSQKVFDLYPYQLKRVWDRQVYSGKANSPRVIDNENDLVEFIIGTPNALSYISDNSELLRKHQGDFNVITVY